MWRFLFKRFANEKFIEYLSETKLIRRAAQMTVATLYRFVGDKHIADLLKSDRVGRILNSFKDNVKKELEDVKREMKKGQRQ